MLSAIVRERGFILQPTYRIESGHPVVHLYGKLESGRSFLVRDSRQTPHFYVREADAARTTTLGASPLSATGKTTMSGEAVVRVEVATPAGAPPLRDRLVAAGIACYEADVRFALRGLIDRGIRGSLVIEGEPREGAGSLVVFDDPEIGPADWTPKLSVLAFDIETDPAARRLLAISLFGCGASEVLLRAPSGTICPRGAVPFATERDLLRAFCSRVRQLDPDVLTGWNVIDFDLAVLARLAGRLGVALEAGRGPGGVRVETARSVWGSSRATIPGRVVLDGIQLLRGAFIRMEDYSLDAVAREVLGEGKTLAGRGRAEEILRLFQEDLPRFVEYNLADSRLTLSILEKLRLVELAVERSRLTGMPPDRVSASIASFDFLYLSELGRRGVVAPTVRGAPVRAARPGQRQARLGSVQAERGETGGTGARAWPSVSGLKREVGAPGAADEEHAGGRERDASGSSGVGLEARNSEGAMEGAGVPVADEDPWEATLGGHVLEPEPGLYQNVLVFDFKSLYPSLIRTFQIDPLGYVARDPERKFPASPPSNTRADEGSGSSDRGSDAPAGPIIAPNGARFRREPGILPGLLDDLFPRREKARRSGDLVTSNAIKILMNSFYGVLGTPACRFYSPEIANAITSFGRELLRWSKSRIEESGLRVLYGDTDSLFVLSGNDDPAAARKLGLELAQRLNREISAHVGERWRVESRLELEFEDLYLRLLLPHVRHGSGGARKRYAGLVEEAGEKRVVFIGMEVVRRDWTDLAREVQRELYERLFTDRPVDEYLRAVVLGLRAGRFDDKLVYRKALRKDLGEYTASTPPHVAAARKMSRAPGRLVSYVITTAGPEPAGERSSPLDHEHYVQKQIRPIAEPVLEVLGADFDRIIGDERQLELF